MLLRGEQLLQRKKEERRKQQQEENARESTSGTDKSESTSDGGRKSEGEENDQQEKEPILPPEEEEQTEDEKVESKDRIDKEKMELRARDIEDERDRRQSYEQRKNFWTEENLLRDGSGMSYLLPVSCSTTLNYREV